MKNQSNDTQGLMYPSAKYGLARYRAAMLMNYAELGIELHWHFLGRLGGNLQFW